jgi:hypothetical protein
MNLLNGAWTWGRIAQAARIPEWAARAVLSRADLVRVEPIKTRLARLEVAVEQRETDKRSGAEHMRWILHEIGDVISQWEASGEGERDPAADALAAAIIRLLE